MLSRNLVVMGFSIETIGFRQLTLLCGSERGLDRKFSFVISRRVVLSRRATINNISRDIFRKNNLFSCMRKNGRIPPLNADNPN